MTFYMPKLVLISSLWLLVVSLSLWQEFKQLRDPTYDYQFDTGYATVSSLLSAEISNILLCSSLHRKSKKTHDDWLLCHKLGNLDLISELLLADSAVQILGEILYKRLLKIYHLTLSELPDYPLWWFEVKNSTNYSRTLHVTEELIFPALWLSQQPLCWVVEQKHGEQCKSSVMSAVYLTQVWRMAIVHAVNKWM